MPVYFGYDESGNNNNWTSFNFADGGTETDSMVDVPTNWGGDSVDSGGEVRGNYATWSATDKAADVVVSNGGLQLVPGFVNQTLTKATQVIPSGKFYFEVTCLELVADASAGSIGFSTVSALPQNGAYLTWASNSVLFEGSTGQSTVFGTLSSYSTAWNAGEILGVAIDTIANTITFYKNNSSQGVITDARITPNTLYPVFVNNSTSGSRNVLANFGQRPFAYTPPTGFKSLNTKNMNEQAAFATGPDLVWIKRRDSAGGSSVHDTVRGITRHLTSNINDAEYNEVTGGGITSVSSNGFTLGIQNVGPGDTNAAGGTYVTWNWNAGSRTVGNQDGTIASTVRANKEAGFSIVTFNTAGTAGTVGHGLGIAPKMIIVKVRNAAGDWAVYTQMTGTNAYLRLHSTAVSTSPAFWSNTAPTSTVFSLDNTWGSLSYVAYCWAEIPGYSNFGSYTGNGSSSGPFIYTGFRPKYIVIKRTDATENWFAQDTSRIPFNGIGRDLYLNRDLSEGTSLITDILSNGFKIRNDNASCNASSGSYIYYAFAEMPFRYGLAR